MSIKRNTIYNAINTIAGILFPLIVFPYTSRILQPENIGKVSFATSYVSYFALIASLGIRTYAIRECSAVRNDKQQLETTASQIFTINVYTTLVASILLGTTLALFRALDDYRVLIIISSVPMYLTALGTDWLNFAMEDFRYITLRTIGFQILSLVALFVFVRSKADYVAYAIIAVVSAAGANILNVGYRRRFCRIRLVKKIDLKRHMPPVLLLFSMLISQQILTTTDVTMLGLMRTNQEVGIYSTALKISTIVSQLVFSILWVLLPRLSKQFSEGLETERNTLLRKALGFLWGFGLPCAIGVMLVGKDVILIIAGQEYLEAAPILNLIMVGFIFDLLGGGFIGNLIMLPSKKEHYFLIACVIAAIANAVLNYLFIPGYGMAAAAVATAISRIIVLLVLVFTVDRSIRINNLPAVVLPPVVGCAAMFGVYLGVQSLGLPFFANLAAVVVLSVVVYAIVLRLFRYEVYLQMESQLMARLKRIIAK